MEASLAEVLGLTLFVAGLSTALLMVPGVLLGYLLARRSFPGKRLVSTLTSLPMVLPPTAVGFLLLQVLATDGPLGRATLGIDLEVLLTWRAAVLASATMSLPLVVRTARITFEGIDPRLEDMARTLGHGSFRTFVRFSLPMARRGLFAAGILGFTRALGEFGATVTIAGNIPGRTQTLAGAIYQAQQSGAGERAEALMWIAMGLGFVSVWLTERLAERVVVGSNPGERP